VILNVNLAILNMLPIPPLDGSHITLAIVEAIRRRPANAHIVRVVEIVQTACTIAIIAFMLYIMSLDVQDLSIFHGDQLPKFGHGAPAAASPAPAAPK
jgi:regulator of sigma E protease